MKTLIVYASYYGATREIAQRIAKKIEGAEVVDLRQNTGVTVRGNDCVIIGSPLYAGMIRKEVKAFVTGNADALRGKTVGLFLSGFEKEKADEYFKNNFPRELVDTAKAKCFPGGMFDTDKATFIHKLMLKIVKKEMKKVDTIDDAAIDRFVGELTAVG